jgi:hypothetical protein
MVPFPAAHCAEPGLDHVELVRIEKEICAAFGFALSASKDVVLRMKPEDASQAVLTGQRNHVEAVARNSDKGLGQAKFTMYLHSVAQDEWGRMLCC